MSSGYEKYSKAELIEKLETLEVEKRGSFEQINQRYDAFFTRNLAGLYRSQPDGKIVDCNNALAQILGYGNKENLIGSDAKKLYVNKKDRSHQLLQLQRKSVVRNEKVALRRKDGETIWCSLSVSRIKDPKTDEVYLEGALMDITELIEIQELLKQSELNYKNTLDHSPYGIIIHHQKSIQYFNKAAEEILNKKLKVGDLLPQYLQNLKTKKMKDRDIQVLDHLKIKQGKSESHISVHINDTIFQNKKMKEISFVDIRDRIDLQQEQLKTEVFKNLNDQLKSEIDKKEEAERELTKILEKNTKQAARLQSIFRDKYHIIFSMDRSYRLTAMNENFKELFVDMFGITPKLKDKPLDYKEMSPKGKEIWKKKIDLAFEGIPTQFDANTSYANGRKRFTSVYLNPIQEGDKINQISVIGHDITDKIIAETKLKESLQEKEILLKEVHHRVKNNLQVISSIFNLQGAYSEDPLIRDVLKESQNRIKSMAYIHESLYKSENFGKINFEDYLVKLCNSLIQTYAVRRDQVKLHLKTVRVLMNLDQAIPCGLIVNEIISNSMKHAFKGDVDGMIVAELFMVKEMLHLTIRDNGMGMPDNFNTEESKTLGFQLIHTLTEQLQGQIEITGKEGTSITLKFEIQSK